MASAIPQRRPNRWAVALGLILYCTACWAVVVIVAENLYQVAAPHEVSASTDGVSGSNNTAR